MEYASKATIAEAHFWSRYCGDTVHYAEVCTNKSSWEDDQWYCIIQFRFGMRDIMLTCQFNGTRKESMFEGHTLFCNEFELKINGNEELEYLSREEVLSELWRNSLFP